MSSTCCIEPLEKPDKTRCVHCGCSESPTQPLRRCAKCRSAPYCSVDCQKADWKSHKQVCNGYLATNSLNYTGLYVGEKTPRPKKGDVKRTRRQILNDLKTFAETHNGDTLTIASWHLMDLVKDITRARTHFLLLTLRRSTSSNPRTLYSLIDATVFPFSTLEEAFSNRSLLQNTKPEFMSCMEAITVEQEKMRRNDGALECALVMSMELPHGDSRSPQNALKEMAVHTFQPLSLFKVHKDSLSRLPTASRDYYISCLKNALAGGAYSSIFHPYTPPP